VNLSQKSSVYFIIALIFWSLKMKHDTKRRGPFSKYLLAITTVSCKLTRLSPVAVRTEDSKQRDNLTTNWTAA
jgi:hypothetical protein